MANKLTQYLLDSKQELKNVTWPTKKELKNHTLAVIGISIVVALFLGLVDYILSFGFNLVIR
ncbi:MAG: preprotein translocase subunit SecE [bacterium]